MDKLQEAIDRATKLHEGQTRRDGEPYINHVMRVYQSLIDNTFPDEEELIVTVLHDTIEDGHTTFEEIESRFGSRVARHVLGLTRKEGQSYEDYIGFICNGFSCVAPIKFFDICDNLTDKITKEKRKVYIRSLMRLAGLTVIK